MKVEGLQWCSALYFSGAENPDEPAPGNSGETPIGVGPGSRQTPDQPGRRAIGYTAPTPGIMKLIGIAGWCSQEISYECSVSAFLVQISAFTPISYLDAVKRI